MRKIEPVEHLRFSTCRGWETGYPLKEPRKIRQLISDLQRAGFVKRGGKGSHRNFEHAASGVNVTLSGQAGEDARNYQEKEIKEAIEKVTRT